MKSTGKSCKRWAIGGIAAVLLLYFAGMLISSLAAGEKALDSLQGFLGSKDEAALHQLLSSNTMVTVGPQTWRYKEDEELFVEYIRYLLSEFDTYSISIPDPSCVSNLQWLGGCRDCPPRLIRW